MARYDVANRSAIVTGAGSGIGRAIALELADNGAAVLIADIDEGHARSVVDEITGAGGTAAPFAGDVSDYADVERMVAAAGELGPLRILVNNAGINGDAEPAAAASIERWQRVIEVNLSAVFYCTKAALPAMVAAGGGSVVNIASVLGTVGFPTAGSYVTAKHGLLGLTKNVALEYGGSRVRANAVGPGFIATPLLEANLDEATQAVLADKHALGRLGTSEEVSALVCFLASDAASFVTGSYHLVDGGYAAQ